MLSISALKLEEKWEQIPKPLYGIIIQIRLYRIVFLNERRQSINYYAVASVVSHMVCQSGNV